MKTTTLIAIENDADHFQAKALVGKLMGVSKVWRPGSVGCAGAID